MTKIHAYTTSAKVITYEAMIPLLSAMYTEFKDLSKKSLDSVVSKNKIVIVNRLLSKVRLIIEDEESLEFLDLLNEDDIPQVSDATLMLSQYAASMSAFREKYYGWTGFEHNWFIR